MKKIYKEKFALADGILNDAIALLAEVQEFKEYIKDEENYYTGDGRVNGLETMRMFISSIKHQVKSLEKLEE